MRRAIASVTAALGLLVGAASGCSSPAPAPSVTSSPNTSPSPTVDAVTVLARHLDIPWGIAWLPDGTALVTERRTAKILRIQASGAVSVVQTVAEVRPNGEAGLLGIAVSPHYASDGWVYIYYSTASDNRIARLHLGGALEPIFTGIPTYGNHNGGRIAFGPDGLLYAGTGDAGARNRAQDLTYLGGKILRLTPDGKPAPGNPFPGSPIYSYGHRNVQGLAWDSTGQLYASEFGQNAFDELNRIMPGKDYGWPIVEGMGTDPRFVNPVATWTTSDASPSGIAILHDTVYIACLRGTKLYRVGTDGRGATALLSGAYGRLRTVSVAPDGSLWIMTSNRDGRGSPVTDDDRLVRVDPTRV